MNFKKTFPSYKKPLDNQETPSFSFCPPVGSDLSSYAYKAYTSFIPPEYPMSLKTGGTKAPVVPKKEGAEQDGVKKRKHIIREAGGEVWEDPTLLEWNENDYRIFCGDLGNETTDDVLFRAFSKYPSIVKAKVVRDKRSNKSKGYGFVSFRDLNDFIAAMKEMNGKYVGNRPIKLRKSNWQDRNVEEPTKEHTKAIYLKKKQSKSKK